jgi:hypothetical protein
MTWHVSDGNRARIEQSRHTNKEVFESHAEAFSSFPRVIHGIFELAKAFASGRVENGRAETTGPSAASCGPASRRLIETARVHIWITT